MEYFSKYNKRRSMAAIDVAIAQALSRADTLATRARYRVSDGNRPYALPDHRKIVFLANAYRDLLSAGIWQKIMFIFGRLPS